MIIRLPLVCVYRPWRDTPRFEIQLVTNFTATPVTTITFFGGYKQPANVQVEAILLHDLFHHAALGVPRSWLGEYYTTHLDLMYPWFDQTRSEHYSEKAEARKQLRERGIPVPTRKELKAFRAEARAKLGYLDPRSYYKTLRAAFTSFADELRKIKNPTRIRVDLVVSTHDRKAWLEKPKRAKKTA